jgi:hypothetical protein
MGGVDIVGSVYCQRSPKTNKFVRRVVSILFSGEHF